MLVEYFGRVRHQTNEPTTNNTIQPHLPDDAIIPINFKRYDHSVVNCHSGNYDILFLQSPILATQETITNVSFSDLLSYRDVSAALMCDVLSRMEVPQAAHHVVVNAIFTALESAKTIMPICVDIFKLMMQQVETTHGYEGVIARVTRESMDEFEVKAIPAAKSSIDGLERVLVNGDVKESSCVICMESFEDGVKGIRLPCSHVFHEKCCVEWLMTSQVCPLCRYQVASEQDLLANS